MRILIVLTAIGALTAGVATAGDPPRFMIEATVRGTHLEGAPLAWSNERVLLLGRDGRLWDFPPDEARDFRKTASSFSPYSAHEIRALLEAELGQPVEMSVTPHFLVAYPEGRHADWGERFERFYREYFTYFRVRHFAVHDPEVPLVAIVLTRQGDFSEFARREGSRLGPNALAYYARGSNRLTLFDNGTGQATDTDWEENSTTIVHETAQLLACNTGVLSRPAPPPRWLTEGIGTLFEARGVWDSDVNYQLADRINRSRLADFKRMSAQRAAPWLPRLTASDRPFQENAAAADCQSWALTFFLIETQPRAFADYLAKNMSRTPLAPYASNQRTADFVAAFGDDGRTLNAKLLKFLDDLP